MDTNYNLSGLVDRVKARLKDADYDEADIKQFLNDAYFEVVGEDRYTFLEREYKATAVKGGEMILPLDFQTLIHLTAQNANGTTGLKYLEPNEFLNTSPENAAKLYRYTIFGGKLLIELPNIEDSEEDPFYTLRLYYLAKPIAMTEDTDAPLIPSEYGEILVLLALKRCEQLRDNFDFAQIYENSASDQIINMKSRYCPRQMDSGNRARLPLNIQTRF